MNLVIINIHEPIECKEDMEKDIFYKKTKIVLVEAPKNTIQVIIGDYNATIKMEKILIPTVRLKSLHERTSSRGQRII